MTFNAMTEHYEEITVCGKPALFTSIRIINCFLGFLIGRFDQRQRISDLCPSNSLCRMKKSLQTAINPVSTCGMIFVQSDRPGFLRQDPADRCVDEVIQIAEESGAEIQFY